MREILFRGKRVDNGKWVTGYYVYDKKYKKHYIYTGTYESSDHFMEPDEFLYEEVVPDTIGQYTGLTDKDGKRIFEGDIIEVHTIDGNHIRRAVVEYGQYNDVNADWYDDYCLGWFIRFEGDCMSILQDNKSILEICEVIGNIYDNSELLGVKEWKD